MLLQSSFDTGLEFKVLLGKLLTSGAGQPLLLSLSLFAFTGAFTAQASKICATTLVAHADQWLVAELPVDLDIESQGIQANGCLYTTESSRLGTMIRVRDWPCQGPVGFQVKPKELILPFSRAANAENFYLPVPSVQGDLEAKTEIGSQRVLIYPSSRSLVAARVIRFGLSLEDLPIPRRMENPQNAEERFAKAIKEKTTDSELQVEFSPNGKFLLGWTSVGIQIFEIASQELKFTHRVRTGQYSRHEVTSAKWGANGEVFVYLEADQLGRGKIISFSSDFSPLSEKELPSSWMPKMAGFFWFKNQMHLLKIEKDKTDLISVIDMETFLPVHTIRIAGVDTVDWHEFLSNGTFLMGVNSSHDLNAILNELGEIYGWTSALQKLASEPRRIPHPEMKERILYLNIPAILQGADGLSPIEIALPVD